MITKITLVRVIQITIKVWLAAYGANRTGYIRLITREISHLFPEFY